MYQFFEKMKPKKEVSINQENKEINNPFVKEEINHDSRSQMIFKSNFKIYFEYKKKRFSLSRIEILFI